MSNYNAVKQSVDEGLQASRPDCSFKSEQSPTVNSEAAKPECCACGHLRSSHIHEEGTCRPGFACQDSCNRYVSRDEPLITTPATVRIGREIYVREDLVNKLYASLLELVNLKETKAFFAEMPWKRAEYENLKPIVWANAREAIDSYRGAR